MSEERKVRGVFTVENARIILKNFAGRRTEYNEEGNRNFGVLISDEDAERLEEDGWNVKYSRPQADDPTGYRQPWLPVKVKFGDYPPVVYLIKKNNGNPKKIRLDERTIDQLDWSNIESWDVQIRPYNYPARSGRPAGVSAYLKRLFAVAREDDLDLKYGSIPEIGEELEDYE